MGLDMCLAAKKHVSGFDWANPEEKKAHAALVKAAGLKKGDLVEGSAEISFGVGYWRKANQIHAWFVKNVQDGEDDCGEYEVSRAMLEKLKATCEEVLDKGSVSLLPTSSGFFFGETVYGHGYIEDLKDTVRQLTAILGNPKLGKGWYFYNQSSW